jgi:hypothetical protein
MEDNLFTSPAMRPLPIMSIENPTLAHFRYFSSLFTLSHLYICREPSTNQLLFMQNKPNFRKSQMNVNIYNRKNYENKSNWTIGQNKPNLKPNKPCPACPLPNRLLPSFGAGVCEIYFWRLSGLMP